MANVIIPQRFWTRRGTAADLTAANETLYAGEWCLETDTGKAKYGDGASDWATLDYSIPGRYDLTGLADGDSLIWVASAGVWVPGTPAGGVQTIVPGTGISVDDTDPENPIVSAAGGGSTARGYATKRLKSTGAFQSSSNYGGSPTTSAGTPNRQFFQPFTVDRAVTLASVMMEVTTAASAGGVVRVGVYDNDEAGANSVPGALLVQTANIATDSLGQKTSALAITLSPGVVYWISTLANNLGATYRAYPATSFPAQWFGLTNTASSQPANHLYIDVTTGWSSMLSPYSGTYVLRSANIPAVFLIE